MTISKESEIDALKLYFGEPFVIENDTYNDIIINQPTIGDIIKSGEKKIYSTINIFYCQSYYVSHAIMGSWY